MYYASNPLSSRQSFAAASAGLEDAETDESAERLRALGVEAARKLLDSCQAGGSERSLPLQPQQRSSEVGSASEAFSEALSDMVPDTADVEAARADGLPVRAVDEAQGGASDEAAPANSPSSTSCGEPCLQL